ncbi:MAG: TraB/GumN family protein [Steroidobacteraceae bacterium]|jgi:uncharacterized protein YbaP (TraB family)
MRRFLFCLIFGLAYASLATAAHHTFWTVRGAHNTVYLLGSVHVLKPEDSALPAEVQLAYTQSKTVVLEVNLNDLSTAAMLGASIQFASLPEGQTLADTLGPDLYRSFVAHANALGVDPDVLTGYQPWFAALMLDEAQMAKLGFAASAGVDEQLAARAQSDNKELIGLETVEDQFSVFSQLSLDEQRRYVRFSLASLDSAAADIEATVSAWRQGDTGALERLLDEDFKDFPDLRRRLTVDRNQRWLEKIVPMLHANQDYLVVVGALHLVGSGGLVDLLQKRGFQVTQH